jgi:hypothetical protein
MPSKAFADHLSALLDDADDLLEVHAGLRAGRPGRQWGLGAINRAVVVTCVSAWEAYVEAVVVEALAATRPAPGTPLGPWPALNASARSAVGRFNNPNVDQVRALISDSLGLADITAFWTWKNCSPTRARELLAEALALRHQIAHGVNPRPIVHSPYASRLPAFFRRLASRTDAGIRDHLVTVLGIADPWPS